MIKTLLKIAYRNLLNNKVYSVINICGLALSMAVCILIALWIDDELKIDKSVGRKGDFASVYQTQLIDGERETFGAVPRPVEHLLRDQYAHYFDHIVMARWASKNYFKRGESKISAGGFFIQPQAPELFDLEILKGNKNGLEDIDGLMLSASFAKSLFGEEDPIGKTLTMDTNSQMQVTAIYKDFDDHSQFSSRDFLAPWRHHLQDQPWIEAISNDWNTSYFQLFLTKKREVSFETIDNAIRDIKKQALGDAVDQIPSEFFVYPAEKWHLYSNFQNGKPVGGAIKMIRIFATIAVFILLLSTINFMNLSTARSEKRAKEVGVKKVIGGQKHHLVFQFYVEFFLQVVIAFALSILLVMLSLGGFNTLSFKEIEMPWTLSWFWLGSLAFLVVVTLLSGTYPALYLSSFTPAVVLKGVFKKKGFSGNLRKLLVITQFVVSTVLIIGTVVVRKQANHVLERELGYDKDKLIYLTTYAAPFVGKYPILREAFLSSGALQSMTNSYSPPFGIFSKKNHMKWRGKPEGLVDEFGWNFVDFEYIETMKMKITQGRDFSRALASDSNAILINQTAAKYLNFKNPIGELLRDPSDTIGGPWKIIGVVEDVITNPLSNPNPVLYPFNRKQEACNYIMRLNPQNSVEDNLFIIEKTFDKFIKELPFEYRFTDERYQMMFKSMIQFSKLIGSFSAVAILISCLGLFGLTSFIAERRTKEIGIRKSIGATTTQIWKMLSKEFLILVTIAMCIAIPLAYYIFNAWLADYNYHVEMKFSFFLIGILFTVLVSMVTVSFQAIKAAKSNPVKSLKTE